METDQTGQVQEIWGMDSKDFPCSSKRNLLCPADDFLSQPEMGEKKKKLQQEKNQVTIFFLSTSGLNVLRLEAQGYLYLCRNTWVLVRILTMTNYATWASLHNLSEHQFLFQ